MSLKKQFSKTKPVCKVTFTLSSEAIMTGDQVVVLGEFNNWDRTKGIPMKASKGVYTAQLELEAGRDYQFRYLIDNEKWENDWAADNYVPNPYGVDNSVVVLPEVKKTTKAAPKKVTTTAKVAAPKKTVAKKATVAKADDLKKIEGVGPKIASLLNAAGIVTFADLGKAKLSTLKEVLDNAGKRFQMHDPKTWSKQAKLAAKGDWATLKTLQDKLNGGK